MIDPIEFRRGGDVDEVVIEEVPRVIVERIHIHYGRQTTKQLIDLASPERFKSVFEEEGQNRSGEEKGQRQAERQTMREREGKERGGSEELRLMRFGMKG